VWRVVAAAEACEHHHEEQYEARRGHRNEDARAWILSRLGVRRAVWRGHRGSPNPAVTIPNGDRSGGVTIAT